MSIAELISVTFGATELSAGAYQATDTDAFSAPLKDVTIIELARADGSLQLLDRLKGRNIVVEGWIVTDSVTELRDAMDALKALMLVGEQPLRVTESGSYREWSSAKLNNVAITRGGQDVTFCRFSAEFFSKNPFAIDGATDALVSIAAQTAATSLTNISPGGSYYAAPEISITLTALEPNTTPVSIVIGNPSTSQYLTITATFADGDVITVDTLNHRVFLNSTLISVEGQFPIWMPGAGSFDYSDSASSRTVAISVTNQRKWL